LPLRGFVEVRHNRDTSIALDGVGDVLIRGASIDILVAAIAVSYSRIFRPLQFAPEFWAFEGKFAVANLSAVTFNHYF